MPLSGVFYPGSDGIDPGTNVVAGTIDNLLRSSTVTVSNWLGYLPIILNDSQLIPPLTRRTVWIDPSTPQVRWEIPPYGHRVGGAAPLRRACHYILGDPAPSPQTDPLVPNATLLDSWYSAPSAPGAFSDRWWRAFGDVQVPTAINAQLTDCGINAVLTGLEINARNSTNAAGQCQVYLYPTVQGTERQFLWSTPFGDPADYDVFLPLNGAAAVYLTCIGPAIVMARLLGANSRLTAP